jgi:AcrR family transcriptional regulator
MESSAALAQALAHNDETEVRATPAAAFARAREQFLGGRKIDMVALAGELGIGRATLYRWTSGRDQLIADIAWYELSSLIAHLDSGARGRGPRRIEKAAGGFLDVIANSAPLRAFLAHEGDAGLRLITAPAGLLRPRLVDAVRAVIDAQVARREYDPPANPRVLADGIVAIGERFLYHGGDPAMNPDPETAKSIIGLLLRER